MIEVKFETYDTYFKAYHWCLMKFGPNTNVIRWTTNYGKGQSYDALLFKDESDAMLCRLRWS